MVVRERLTSMVGATFMLLGCLSNSAMRAAQQSPGESAVAPKTSPTPAMPVFKTEVLVTAERGTAPRDESAAAAAVLTRTDIGRIPGRGLPALLAFLDR